MGFTFLPPTLGIEIAVSGTGNRNGDAGREYFFEDVAGPAGVVVRGYDNYAAKMAFGGKAGQAGGFFARAVSIMGENEDFFFGDTPLDEVVLEEFSDANTRAQPPAAGDDDGRNALAHQFSGASGAVGIEIVVAEEKDGVGVGRRSIDYPGFGRVTQDGVAGPIEHRTENDKRDDDN